jgi:hypothetical protein
VNIRAEEAVMEICLELAQVKGDERMFGSKAIRVAVALVAVLLQFPQFVVPAAAQATSAAVAGNWRVTISTPDGTISGVASFKQAGNVVTGWVGPSEDDPIPIDGILKDNKLTIKTSPQSLVSYKMSLEEEAVSHTR